MSRQLVCTRWNRPLSRSAYLAAKLNKSCEACPCILERNGPTAAYISVHPGAGCVPKPKFPETAATSLEKLRIRLSLVKAPSHTKARGKNQAATYFLNTPANYDRLTT